MTVVKSIELVVPRDVYLAGSEVDGQVILSLHSTLINPLLDVQLIGRGYLEWMEESDGNKDYSQASSYINRADYVHRKKTFHIEGNWLDPGVHTFNFGPCCLTRNRTNLHQSVRSICYFAPGLCLPYPLVVEVQKRLRNFCCFNSSPITLRISLCKNIFAPGDSISFTTEITNQTGKSIKKVVFILHSVVLYKGYNLRAERRTLEERSDMMRLESHLEAGSCVDTKIHSTLVLPKVMLVTSSCKSDDIMDIGYDLTGNVHFPCMSTVEAQIPIIIQNEAVETKE
ncbi:arrestin domain-containing protein 5 [Sphaerodactylus townsendi]|uniref:arrestin domain-containing protein 5 n=1 Tax=Sphaerodactylus townsendi TaxID=933632 RepID=UPI002026F14C|nr:arrestin domain-containing protein 5 [Sphaerodactylus townsendi]